jgi:hypothetical protein
VRGAQAVGAQYLARGRTTVRLAEKGATHTVAHGADRRASIALSCSSCAGDGPRYPVTTQPTSERRLRRDPAWVEISLDKIWIKVQSGFTYPYLAALRSVA